MSEPLFEILDGVFGDIDSYTSERELLESNPSFYLSEQDLRDKLQAVLPKLSSQD